MLTLHPDSTTCSCNHSTSFAILLQVYEVQVSREQQSNYLALDTCSEGPRPSCTWGMKKTKAGKWWGVRQACVEP